MAKLKMAVFGSGHGFSTLIPAALSTGLYDIYAANSRFAKQIQHSEVKACVHEVARETLFQDFELDLAVIAVPPGEQLPLATMLVNNSKNLYIEKPAGLNSFEAKQLKILAENHNRNMYVGYQFRFDPGIQYLKKSILDSTSITRLAIDWHTEGNRGKSDVPDWRNNQSKGGGVRTNFLVHVIDYLFYIFGQDRLCHQSNWFILKESLNDISLWYQGFIEIEIKISRGMVKNSYWEISLYGRSGTQTIRHSSPFTDVDYTSTSHNFLKNLMENQIPSDIRIQSTALLLTEIGARIKQGTHRSPTLPCIDDAIIVHKLIESIFNSTLKL